MLSVRGFELSLVQNGIYALRKAHMRSTPSLKFPQRCLWSSSNVRRIDDGPLSSFQGRSSSASSFHTSPPGDRWCVVPGFVPAGSVSSSLKQATGEGCFSRHCVCSVISLHTGMLKVVHPQSVRRWMSTIDTFQSGLPIPLFTVCSKLIEPVRTMACVVRLSPLEAVQRRAYGSPGFAQSYTLLKWLLSLPILMQESFWWRQCSDRYNSLPPHPPFPRP